MDNLTEEELENLEDSIVLAWIEREFVNVTGKKNVKKRKRHTFKHDYWNSNWGRLIRSEDMKDPTSRDWKLFKRRFRIPFGLFSDVLIPMCVEKNIFGTTHESRVRVPLEFKILMCLRILGRGILALSNLYYNKINFQFS
jgi:hypothetical protein